MLISKNGFNKKPENENLKMPMQNKQYPWNVLNFDHFRLIPSLKVWKPWNGPITSVGKNKEELKYSFIFMGSLIELLVLSISKAIE